MEVHAVALVAFWLFALYFLPTIIAVQRSHQQGNAIFLLNLLLGWTFLGWVIALIWSATHTPGKPPPPPARAADLGPAADLVERRKPPPPPARAADLGPAADLVERRKPPPPPARAADLGPAADLVERRKPPPPR